MLSFACDYSEGAHEAVLARLIETNLEQLSGYGETNIAKVPAKKSVRRANVPLRTYIFWWAARRPTPW